MSFTGRKREIYNMKIVESIPKKETKEEIERKRLEEWIEAVKKLKKIF